MKTCEQSENNEFFSGGKDLPDLAEIDAMFSENISSTEVVIPTYSLVDLWPSDVAQGFTLYHCGICDQFFGINGIGKCLKNSHPCQVSTKCSLGRGRWHPVEKPGAPKAICFMSEAETEAHYRKYGFQTMEAFIAEVERKSLADLVQCLARERERFERELIRGRGLDVFAVIVEAALEGLAHGEYRSKLNPHAACQSVMAFTVKYGTPFLFAGNRAGTEYVTWSLLNQYLQGAARRYKGIIKAHSLAVESTPPGHAFLLQGEKTLAAMPGANSANT